MLFVKFCLYKGGADLLNPKNELNAIYRMIFILSATFNNSSSCSFLLLSTATCITSPWLSSSAGIICSFRKKLWASSLK